MVVFADLYRWHWHIKRQHLPTRMLAHFPGNLLVWLWHRNALPVQRVLHVCQYDNPWLQDALNFRDYLTQFAEQRLAYQQRKQALAESCGENLPLYSLEKATLLYRMNKAANRWRAEQEPDSSPTGSPFISSPPI